MRRVRWDGTAVSPVVAVILLLAITIVLASIVYIMVSNIVVVDPGGVGRIGVNYRLTGGNWSISVTTAPVNIQISDVEFFTRDPNGVFVVAPGPLGGYPGFSDQPPTGKLNPGDAVILPFATHPSGSTFTFKTAQTILYEGVLAG